MSRSKSHLSLAHRLDHRQPRDQGGEEDQGPVEGVEGEDDGGGQDPGGHGGQDEGDRDEARDQEPGLPLIVAMNTDHKTQEWEEDGHLVHHVWTTHAL